MAALTSRGQAVIELTLVIGFFLAVALFAFDLELKLRKETEAFRFSSPKMFHQRNHPWSGR